jgi:hypothetical protein
MKIGWQRKVSVMGNINTSTASGGMDMLVYADARIRHLTKDDRRDDSEENQDTMHVVL